MPPAPSRGHGGVLQRREMKTTTKHRGAPPPVKLDALSHTDSESVKLSEKQVRATPSKHDLLRELGPKGYSEKPDGSWTYDVPPDKARRWDGMISESRAADVARGQLLQAAIPRFTVRDADGNVRRIPCSSEAAGAIKERQMAAKGLIHAHVKYGGVRIEKDKDGFLWRELPGGRGWEPLGRKCLTTPFFPEKE